MPTSSTMMMLQAVWIWLALGGSVVHAESRPWAEGVAGGRQAQANRIFAEANGLFARQAYSLARERYVAAVGLWDHPTIQFNLAVTLVRLDRVLEAADAIDAALRYGESPFTPEVYAQVRDLYDRVMGRVGTIEVQCAHPGATVMLDGQPWFVCPGSRQRRVLADEHAIIAEAPGFLTAARKVQVTPGARVSERLALVPIDTTSTRVDVAYPVPRWIPWLVAGIGAAAAGTGFVYRRRAGQQLEQFDSEFAETCAMGCEADLSEHDRLRELREHGHQQDRVGTALLISGGAVVASGIVWAALFNRARLTTTLVEVAPSRESVTLRGTWRF